MGAVVLALERPCSSPVAIGGRLQKTGGICRVQALPPGRQFGRLPAREPPHLNRRAAGLAYLRIRSLPVATILIVDDEKTRSGVFS